MLPDGVIEVADGFWNIRGSFKFARILEIGTQASLVRRRSGKLVLLDACALSAEVQRWMEELTDGGASLEAILNLHPFHTVYVRAVHESFPDAALYGTSRHRTLQPDLPWQPLHTEDVELHRRFADDLEFSVPRGVDFVPSNPKLHFSSVLAFHPGSKTLHVDDTLIHARLPFPLRLFGRDVTRFHPALAKVLEPTTDAAREFRAWAAELIERTRDIDNLCAAHTSVLLGRNNRGKPIADRISDALARVEGKLSAHEKRHSR